MENKDRKSEKSLAGNLNIKERDYWLDRLSGDPDKSIFPYDNSRSGIEQRTPGTPLMNRERFELSGQLFSALMRLSNGVDHTLHVILTAGVMELMTRYMYKGGSDIVVGTPIYKQEPDRDNHEEFINTVLALRTRLETNRTFKELLLQVRQTVVEAVENRDYPIEILAEILGKPISPQDFPLFDTAVLLENIHDKRYLQHIPLNMIFAFSRTPTAVEGVVEYHSLLYEKITINGIIRHFTRLLGQALDNPDSPTADIDILGEDEKKQLLSRFNDTRSGFPQDKTITELFAAQVEKTPHHTAVCSPVDLSALYHELNAENATVNQREREMLYTRCFKKSPFICSSVIQGKTSVILKTHRHNSVVVNRNTLKLLDVFDGKSNITSIFSALPGPGLTFSLYPVEVKDLLEITLDFSHKAEVFSLQSIEDFVRLVKTMYGNHLLRLEGTAAGNSLLKVPLREDFDMDESKSLPPGDIGFLNLPPKTGKPLSKTQVLLLGDTPGMASTGLLYLASYLRRNGIRSLCRFYDTARDYPSMKKNLEELLEKIQPEVVGISLKWFPYISRVLDICKIVKDHSPHVKVVVGGNTAAYYRQKMIGYRYIDYVVRGDGELPLLKICRGEPESLIPNCLYRKNGAIKENPVTYIQDKTNAAEIYLSHLDELLLSQHASIFGTFFIFTHKGCSMNCLYCGGCNRAQQETFNRKHVFGRDPAEVRKDIKEAKKYTSTFQFDFDIPDKNLLDYCKQTWDGIDLSSHFCIFSTLAPPTPGLVEFVSKTFKYIYWDFDICTPSERHRNQLFSLGLVKPQPADEEILVFMGQCEKYQNIEVRLNLITGLPYFTPGDIEPGEKLLSKIMNTYSCFGQLHWARLHAQPGAPIIEDAGKHHMHTYASSFEDFLRHSREHFKKNLTYPGIEDFNYPYIYFKDDRLNSLVTNFYLDTNKKVDQHDKNRQRGLTVNKALTYRELNEKAGRLARILKEKGVKPGGIVGLMLGHSREIPVGILGIMKADCAYMPIDPEFPAGRIEYMLTDSNAKALVTTRSLAEEGEKVRRWEGETILLEDLSMSSVPPGAKSPPSSFITHHSKNLAYVIYTSGTTGKPKGVLLTHENLVNYVHWFTTAVNLRENDKTILTSSFAFDLGYTSLYTSILNGCELHVLPREIYLLAERLLEYIKQERITYIKLTPALFSTIVNSPAFRAAAVRSLRLAVLGGEPIIVEDIEKARSICSNLRVMNHYGPTEATIGCISTFVDFDKFEEYKKHPVIGKPINNTDVYILGKDLNLLPIGVPGELCISGACLARGYLNGPELTTEKFLPVVYRSYKSYMSYIYRSGDLARWLPEGNIEFLGRTDSQVKVRGYRVELGEIENKLLKHKAVKEALVTIKDLNGDDKYLCAYIVPGEEKKPGPGTELGESERTRYRRQMLLHGWGIESQEKLKSTRVFVAGAGGGASPTIMQLALAGFGTIVICDCDVVELSNLNRQFLHDESRIGMNKALSAKMTIERINPHVNVIPLTQKLTRENVLELVGDAEIIFDMFDGPEDKFILSQCAVVKKIPHIVSAMTDINAYAAIFHTPHTPCYHCIFAKKKLETIVSGMKHYIENYNKNPLPVVSTSLFTSTGVAVNEALKILLGFEKPAYNKFFYFNQRGATRELVYTPGYQAMTHLFSDHFRNLSKRQGFDWDVGWRGNFLEELEIEPDPDCPVCGITGKETRSAPPPRIEKKPGKPGKREKRQTIALLREYLSEELPGYMIPPHFVQLDEMPLTPNGKIDRKALPDPETETGEGYAAPGNQVEEKLAEIWSEVLEVDSPISIDDNFFGLGGHSLKATLLAVRIHQAFEVNLSLAEIFETPFIRGLARYINGAAKNRYASIEPVEKKDRYALSSAQRRLYVLQQMELEGIAYNISQIVELEGETEREKLEMTFKKLIDGYESLRTSFELVETQPVQRIHDKVEFEIEYYLATGDTEDTEKNPFDPKSQELKAKSYIKNFIRPFDLSRAPLMRVGLIEIEKTNHILMVDMHHIISDGVSHVILIENFISLYNGKKLPGLRLQYKDFSGWQRSQVVQGAFKQQEEYWLKEFEGEIPILNIPTDYPRPAIQSFEGSVLKFDLNKEKSRKLNDLARAKRATLFMVLLAVYNIFLSKLSNQEDIVVGTPVAGRKHADLEQIIGIFINMLALRNNPKGENTFIEFLETLKKETLAAFENQNYQYEELIEKVSVERDMGRNPLFDVVFILQNIVEAPGSKEITKDEMVGLKIKPCTYEHETSKFDLTLTAVEKGDKLYFAFEYCTKLFKEETMVRFIKYFEKIISVLVENPGVKISEIEIITVKEKKQILVDFNDTKAEYPHNKTIHQLFAEQTERNPDHAALVGIEETRGFAPLYLTYRELNKISDQLAYLLRAEGIKPNSIVGLMVKRSIKMMKGILGILKAGGAYVPIDPGYPGERIKYMLEDSHISILVTEADLKGQIDPLEFEGKIIHPADENPDTENKNKFENTTASHQLAYLIYTSGSTGKPKGIMIEHRNVVNFIIGMSSKIEFEPGRTILGLTTISFDIFVLETLVPLSIGMKVVIANEQQQDEPGLLAEALLNHQIDMLQVTPSRLKLMMSGNNGFDCLKGIKTLMVGGEAFPANVFNSLKEEFKGKIYNLYGPTETTVWSTLKDLTRDSEITIGHPIANTRVYILDMNDKIQPLGIAGELCIGGDGLGKGYVNDPTVTLEKFSANPFIKGKRMYRSGDLARWLPGGDIEFLGRIDHQVKIRGFRIELEEIESKLLSHKQIKEAVVISRRNNKSEKYICAYIVPNSPPTVDSTNSFHVSELRNYLSGSLPGYMIPPYFVMLKKIPLTPNGKVDGKALPEPKVETGEEYMAPRGETQKTLARIWKHVLSLNRVGIRDDYFSLGGDSIKAIKLLSLINEALHTDLKMADLFNHKTIEKLSTGVLQQEYSHGDEALKDALIEIEKLKNRILAESQLPGDEIEDIYPMSDIEIGMVFHWLKEPERAVYHDQMVYQPAYIDFDGERFKNALVLMVEKHPILRTSFHAVGFEEPIQIVHKTCFIDIQHVDILHLENPQQEEYVKKIMAEDRQGPFDVTVPPLWRMRTFALDKDNILVLWVCHHAILDGWSNASFNTELNNIYLKLKTDPGFVPVKLKSSYKESILEQILWKKNKEIRDYWKNELEDYKRLEFPGAAVENKDAPTAVKNCSFDLEPLWDRLTTKAAAYQTPVKHLCFSAYLYMLNMFSYEGDIMVGLVTNNRPLCQDGEKILGCFLNTVPVRVKIPPHIKWSDYIRKIDKKLVELTRYDRVSLFEIAKITGERTRDQNPIFDTLFNFVDFHVYKDIRSDEGNNRNKRDRLSITGQVTVNTLFDFSIDVTSGKFILLVSYSPLLLNDEMVLHLIDYFKSVLNKFIDEPGEIAVKDQLLGAEEKQELLVEFNSTEAEYPKDKTIHQLFEEQAVRNPDHVALLGPKFHIANPKSQTVCITYRELNRKSGQLAYLLKEKGVKPDAIVAIMVNPSLEMIIGILGILKAGGAYLPIDAGYPGKRINFMLEDSKAKVLVTTSSLFEDKKPGRWEAKVVFLSSAGNSPLERGGPKGRGVSKPAANSKNLAYAIYTSGSTGRPKGVLEEHRSAVNMLVWRKEEYKMCSNDTALQLFSYAFDGFVTGFFIPIISGAPVVQVSEEEIKDIDKIREIIVKKQVTHMLIVPALARAIIGNLTAKEAAGLKVISIGGDSLAPDIIQAAGEKNKNIEIINEYGVTEASVMSTIKRHQEKDNQVTIGQPIWNTRVYILDKAQELLSIGAAGELCISGDGLARGYLNKPELTAEKFIDKALSSLLLALRRKERAKYVLRRLKQPEAFQKIPEARSHELRSNPLALRAKSQEPRAKLYKTGDLARWLQEGNIEFLGRIDHQVKIRGYRIELGEIQGQLLNHDHIKDALVAARNDDRGDKYLCAYIVWAGERTVDTSTLKQHLSTFLPGYMVPAYFVLMEKIPLTPNGKVDRKALPAPEADNRDWRKNYVAPQSELEKTIAGVWREVLQLDRIGTGHNFFDLGGNSLTVIQLKSKLERVLNREVPVVVLFEHNTITSFVHYLAESGDESGETGSEVEFDRREEITKAKQLRTVQRNKRKRGNVNV